jgi:hypothetical protein
MKLQCLVSIELNEINFKLALNPIYEKFILIISQISLECFAFI